MSNENVPKVENMLLVKNIFDLIYKKLKLYNFLHLLYMRSGIRVHLAFTGFCHRL
jgi:hypothetical protein